MVLWAEDLGLMERRAWSYGKKTKQREVCCYFPWFTPRVALGCEAMVS